MADPFTLEREAIAAELTAAGVANVSLDRGQAPPFVLVGGPTGPATPPRALGLWPCTIPVTVIALPPGDTANSAWMLEQVTTILRTLGWSGFTPTQWGDEQLPAYQLTYARSVPNPDC